MESTSYLNEIEQIPLDKYYKDLSTLDMINIISTQNSSDCFIEVAFGVEKGLIGLFNARNIPDDLKEAYQASFTSMDDTLYQHYLDMLDRGHRSVIGFISNLKGKYFELQLPDKLEKIYPGYKFNIFEDPTTPVVDIEGISKTGEHLLIQAKMWGADKWSTLEEIMRENPRVLYATNKEIKDKILEKSPELMKQFVPDINFHIEEFTDGIQDNLEVLAGNLGIDVPDKIGEILPHIKEIALGIQLLIDLAVVQRDFSRINMTDKARLSAFKTLVLFSKFGVTLVLTKAGVIIGEILLPEGGGIPGGITGTIAANIINKEIKPYLYEIIPKLLKINPDDMIYYNNKKTIDKLALKFTKIQNI